MYHPFRCITNNPMVMEQGFSNMEFFETDVLGLLKIVLREVSRGYGLLSHPLTGSIRPDITPYKTVLLCKNAAPVDQESMWLARRAVCYAEDLYKLRDEPIYRKWGRKALEDFQCIDLSIIERALEVGEMGR